MMAVKVQEPAQTVVGLLLAAGVQLLPVPVQCSGRLPQQKLQQAQQQRLLPRVSKHCSRRLPEQLPEQLLEQQPQQAQRRQQVML